MSALTLESPEVRKWIEFAEANGGSLPDFPLPLGDQSIPCGGDVHVEQLLGPDQTAQFEAAVQTGGRPVQRWLVCLRGAGSIRVDRRRKRTTDSLQSISVRVRQIS